MIIMDILRIIDIIIMHPIQILHPLELYFFYLPQQWVLQYAVAL